MSDNKDTLTGYTPRPGTTVMVNGVLVPPDVRVVFLQHDGIDSVRLTLPVVGDVWARVTEFGVEKEGDGNVSAYYFDTLPIWYEPRANDMMEATP